MGFFDGLEDPLGEVGDALSDLGAQDGADALDDATRMIQAAIQQNGGVPTPTGRFLIGTPLAGTVPTDQTDWEDAVRQAGYIADNFINRFAPGVQDGFGELGAAMLNQELSAADPREQPLHVVRDFYVEEGLNRPWRAFVTLEQPTFSPAFLTPQQVLDIPQQIANVFSDGGDGWDASDLGDVTTAAGTLLAAWTDPDGVARGAGGRPPVWDSQDPDRLDGLRLPFNHTSDATRTTPQRYLGQFARLCVARRFPVSKHTLNERWFSGVVTGFEDLGLRSGRRAVRLTLRPRLHQLSLRRRYRIFKSLNAVQIVIELLKEHGIYPEDPADGSFTALRLAPGGRDLFGPIGVPDALTSAVDKIASAVPFGVGEEVGDAVNDGLEQPVEDWRPKREHCVQYGETDLELFERLLAEEGLTFFFEHKERRETLVICEDPRLAGKKVLTAGRLPLEAFEDGVRANAATPDNEHAWSVAVTRAPVPSGVTLRDRTYARPYDPTDLKAGESHELLSPSGLSSLTSAGGLEQMANQALGLATELAGTPGTEDYAGPEAQWFEWPARAPHPSKPDDPLVYQAYDGPPMAQLRLEAFRATGAVARGSSECATLAPGANVRLRSLGFDVLHSPAQKAQRFLVTKVVHTGALPGAGLAPGPLTYSNTFEALNVGLAWRPPPPAKRPRIAGVQTAIVVDVAQLDDPTSTTAVNTRARESAWRVRVRFPWERGDAVGGPNDEGYQGGKPDGSPWLRFAQPFTGAGFGVVMVPRVGMEVVVGFDEGDPDRPYVLGTVYSARHAAAAGTSHASTPKPSSPADAEAGRIDQPARRSEEGLTSRSWPQSDLGPTARGSSLRFDDQRTNERIRLFAQHDLAEEVGQDHVTSVIDDQRNTVGEHQRETVGADQTLIVRHRSEGEADWARDVDVQENEDVQIGGGSKKQPAEGQGDPAAGTAWSMIDRIHKNDTLVVGPGGRRVELRASEALRITGEGASADKPGRSLAIKGSSKVEIDDDDVLTVTGDRRVLAEGPHEIRAAKIDITTAASPHSAGAEPTGGLSVSEEGVALTSSGTISIETGSFTARSKSDRVLVKAHKQIFIHDRDYQNEILLDAETKKIIVNARSGTAFRLGTGLADIILKEAEIRLAAGESSWVTSLSMDGTFCAIDGPDVKIAATDEIHIDAPDVRLGQPLSGDG